MITKLLQSILMLTVALVICTGTAWAQETGTIEGTITNQVTGEPLIAANVYIADIQRGAATDGNGHFSIDNVPLGTYQLRVSYIGYTTKTVPVTLDQEAVTIAITLQQNVAALDELVVTALGVERRVNELTYSAQKLDAADITESGSADLIASLSGKVAGLKVSSRNGMGGSTDIILRGINSLTGNNQALFVVDGVPLTNARFNTGRAQRGQYGYDYGSTGLDINPANITSMTVLKGAAATALYGSRASNGAIIITTKRGAPTNENVDITFSSKVGFSRVDPETFPTYQTEYGAGYFPTFHTQANPFTETPGDSLLTSRYNDDASYGPRFDPDLMIYQWDSFIEGNPNYGKPTPWTAANHMPIDFFETGTNLSNSLFLRGGINEGGGYYSLGYTQDNTTGVLPGGSLDKYKLSFAGGYDATDRLHVEASVDYGRTDGSGRAARGYNSLMSNFRQWWETNVDILAQKAAYFRNNLNNSWNPTTDRASKTPLYWNNPYFERYENYTTDHRDRYVGFVETQYDAAGWLSLTGRVSYSGYSQLIESRRNVTSTSVGGFNSGSGYVRRTQDYGEYNFRLLANYNKQLSERITIDGLVGFNVRRTHSVAIAARTNGGLNVPGIYSLNNSVSSILFPNETDRRLGVNGLYAAFNIDYNDLLFLRLTGRRDKASSLPEDENIYYYPSVSASMNFSQLIDANWLSFGKIRVSWAQVGATAPPLSLQDVYNRQANIGSAGRYSLPGTKNNPDLKPEITQSWEAGLQLGLFNDRVYMDATYYTESTFNQIFNVNISNATGFSSKFINAGEIENKGIEIALRGRPVLTNNFSWTIEANWSKNYSKVVELTPGVDYFQFVSTQGGISIGAKVGEPVGVIRGSSFIIDEETGQPIVDGDGYYKVSESSNEVIGNMLPDWRSGITNRFNYKNWSLNVLVDVRWGGDIFSLDQWYGQGTGLYPITAGLNKKGNPKRDPVAEGGGVILPGVTEDGEPNTTYAEVGVTGAYGYFRNPHEAYIYDGSYIKLREVGLTYNLPQSLLESIGVLNNASISAVGRNLWIIHKNLPYADPEASLSAGNAQGFSGGNLPAIRSITFNLKLNF